MGLCVPLNIGCEERIDYGRSEKEKVIVNDKVSKNTRPKTRDSKKRIYNYWRIGKNMKNLIKTMRRDNIQQG